MIVLHKLNGLEIVVNAELIESVEAGQQTVVSLTTGNRYLVKESAAAVTELVVEYRRRLRAEPGGGEGRNDRMTPPGSPSSPGSR